MHLSLIEALYAHKASQNRWSFKFNDKSVLTNRRSIFHALLWFKDRKIREAQNQLALLSFLVVKILLSHLLEILKLIHFCRFIWKLINRKFVNLYIFAFYRYTLKYIYNLFKNSSVVSRAASTRTSHQRRLNCSYIIKGINRRCVQYTLDKSKCR